VVVGWTDPEGSRPFLGALLLAYYDPDGRLVYAGRAGTGIDTAELERYARDARAAALMCPWTQEIAMQQAWEAALGLDGQRGAAAGA
jgi:hypothetical protein